MLAEVFDGEGKDIRPHDGIEQANSDHRPERGISSGKCRHNQQADDDEGKYKQCPGGVRFPDNESDELNCHEPQVRQR